MSRLLALPAELRLTIFELAVVSPDPIVVPLSGRKARPALLHVSQQIRSEATKAYYKLNSFRLLCDGGSKEDFPVFAQVAGAEKLSVIQSFTTHFNFKAQVLETNEACLRREPALGGGHDAETCICFFDTCMAWTSMLILVGELVTHGLRPKAVALSGAPIGKTQLQERLERGLLEKVHQLYDEMMRSKDMGAYLARLRKKMVRLKRKTEELRDGSLSPAELYRRVVTRQNRQI